MRYYSATAVRTQLTASISGSATVATVASTSGFPASVPFTLLLEPGQLTEEVVSVTSVGGLTLTLARGQDGTSAVPHDVGADIRHGLSARDLREPQEHIAAVNGVHGVDGYLVGDTDVQGLTNKSIDGNLNTLTNVPKTALPSDTVYTATSQTLTNKTLSGATNTITALPVSALTVRPYAFRNSNATNIGVGSAAWSPVANLDAEANSNVSYQGTGVWTINTPGIYRVDAFVSFVANATGRRGIRARKNALPPFALNVIPATAEGYVAPACSGEIAFDVNDTITVEVYQTSGGGLDCGAPGRVAIQYMYPAA